ncbi:MAG TPA: DUF2232 domain-containing protein [Thermoanaerobaculia bacterium]|nr:DUF2232 domain-containing protein [Thermoanaerobaculia bacterium]
MSITTEPVPVIATGQDNPVLLVRSTLVHALVAAFMFVSPLILFVPATLLNSGLRNGWKGVWGALIGGVALLGLVAIAASRPGQLPAQISGAARLLFEVGMPTLVVFGMIRQRFRFGPILLAALGTGVLGFLLTELVMQASFAHSPYSMLVNNFRRDTLRSFDFYKKAGMPADALAIMKSLSEGIASTYMPFLLIVITITMFVLSMLMVSRLPAGKATGSSYFFRNLVLPDALLFAFVAGGLAPLATGLVRSLGLNLLATVGFLYFLQGLAILRFMLVSVKAGFFAMTVAFGVVTLLTLYGVAPFLLFLAGLFDPFFDFRHFNKKDDAHESHID